MRRNDVTPNHVLKKPCTMHITISRVRSTSPCPSTVSYTTCPLGPRNYATVCPSSHVTHFMLTICKWAILLDQNYIPSLD